MVWFVFIFPLTQHGQTSQGLVQPKSPSSVAKRTDEMVGGSSGRHKFFSKQVCEDFSAHKAPREQPDFQKGEEKEPPNLRFIKRIQTTLRMTVCSGRGSPFYLEH